MVLPGFVAEGTIRREPTNYFIVESVVNNENGNIYPQQSNPFTCMNNCCCRFYPRAASCPSFVSPIWEHTMAHNYCITGDSSQGNQCYEECQSS
jgi:hypothetical protein